MRFLCAFFALYSHVVRASLGLAEALIDDKNPSVHYTGSTSTLTRDSITFSFTGMLSSALRRRNRHSDFFFFGVSTGTSVWVSFRVVGDGECTISIDGTRVASINSTSPNVVNTGGGSDPTPYANTTMSNGGHTLLLAPGPDTQIEFFEATIGFLTDPSARHVNVGAIVGGVLGGVFFIACLILIFYLFRRRNMAKRASSRGFPKVDNLEPGAKNKVTE
ncbi:hypothetical protein B0H13DRAFT_2402482 [Mycena leptocephala]|nr:hypothetical protein B0H13DRAFT_2402482 [Mycena leptocephala]